MLTPVHAGCVGAGVYLMHDGLLLLRIYGDTGAVSPRVGAQVAQAHIRVTMATTTTTPSKAGDRHTENSHQVIQTCFVTQWHIIWLTPWVYKPLLRMITKLHCNIFKTVSLWMACKHMNMPVKVKLKDMHVHTYIEDYLACFDNF